jgi:putative DNA primase/helicase
VIVEVQSRIDALTAKLKAQTQNKEPIDPAEMQELMDLRRERDKLLSDPQEAALLPPHTNGNGAATIVEADPEAPEQTEDALALEFTAQHALDWRYVAAWGDWLKWDGQRWKKESTLHVFDRIRRICRQAAENSEKPKTKSYSAATVSGVERLAKSDRRHAATTDLWDLDFWLLNTPGGVADLKIGQVKAHDRAYHMTKLAAGDAARPGRPNKWLAFLADVTNGDAELQGYLARVAGYALTGSTDEHALFFFYGTGANGKSVFLNTLASVMGEYAANAPIETFMESRSDRHPTDLASLRGARAVIAMEVENGRRWAESKIKSLVGGDKISARFMRQDFFEYRPQFKLLIAGNHKPGLRDVDEAMRRRLHLIPFTVTIPAEKRNKTLARELLEEKDAILAWMIAGCVEWQERGLCPPRAVLAATDEYFEAEDTLQRWIEEECTTDPNDTATTADLFKSWQTWAENAGEFVVPLKRFVESLIQRGYARHVVGEQRLKGFRGIAVKSKF